ncbi:MAG: carboxypeptidase regulatory-like domain-containing protein [Bryobacteraceae bacterium]
MLRLAVLLFLAALAMAQDYRGSILGRVTDASGAVIPGATVTVTNQGTNARNTTESNAEGNFLVPLLEPGSYTMMVEAAGFKQVRHEAITVRTGDRVEMNFQLEVGGTAESITVTGDAPLIQTNSADLAQVIDRRFLDLLYIPDRNPLSLIGMTPGVRGGGGQFADSGQHEFSVHGGGATQVANEIVVDGASVVMPRQGGSIASSPSGDVVEELRVQTTMFDAAYGHTNGGVVTYATRSGTNQVHGSFEGFLRNKALNANSWLNNKRGLQRPDDSRQFYSGAFGGPVYLPKIYDGRNRTFFFTSVQYERMHKGTTESGRVPTELERQGDFSQTISGQGGQLAIYNPYSTVVTGSTATRQPFAGNRIPQSMLNTTGVAIAAAFPKPNLNVPAQIGVYNWAALVSVANPAKQISQRIDQIVSSKQRLFGRFGYMGYGGHYTNMPVGLYTAPIGGDVNTDLRHFYNISLNDDYTFSPTLIGSLRYSFARYWSDTFNSGNVQDPKVLKLPDQLLANQMRTGWPSIAFGEGGIGLGSRYKTRANDSHALVPTLTKLAGSHNLRIGGEVRQVSWNEISPGTAAAGSFTFSAGFTQSDPFTSASSRTSGSGIASMVLGVPSSGSLGGPTPYAMRSYFYAGFVQDDWKITPKLTINLGMRWELETPYTERYNRLAYGFDYNAPSPVKVPGMNLRGGLLFAGTNGLSRSEGTTDWNNIGPRFGFAYQLRPGTVIRGGYGLFYSSVIVNMDTTIPVPPTFALNAPYVSSTDRGATPYTNLSNPFPNGITPPPGSSLGMASRVGDSVSFTAQDRVLPYSQQWQFGVQQALPGEMKFEAAFVRMLSLKGLESFNLNEKPDQYLALGAAENNKVPNPFYGIISNSSNLGSGNTISQRQFWLAYPQFTSVNQDGSNTRTVVYHALELSLEKRLTHGLTLMWNLTGSKMIENNITSLVNTRYYRCISDMDRPYMMNLAFVYDLPFGRGKLLAQNGAVAKLFGGWSLSGRARYSSGTPLSISDSNGRPIRLRNAAKSGPIVERIGDRVDPVTRQVLNPYFDTTAFASLPTQYTVSPEVPYFAELRNPASKTLDLSLVKRVTIRERLNFDIRADASSVTNTPQWGGPGTSMSNKATFGVIQSAGGSRRVQLSFRAVF